MEQKYASHQFKKGDESNRRQTNKNQTLTHKNFTHREVRIVFEIIELGNLKDEIHIRNSATIL